MRINIISNQKEVQDVAQDVQILHGVLAHALGESIQVRHVPYFHPQCPEADVNFFMEVVNPSLLMYAGRNVWIANPEWTRKTWEPYARMVDEIWVKTRDAEKLFQQWVAPEKIRYIGWTSIDKVMPTKKNYWKAIVPCGTNVWRNPTPILKAYTHIKRTDPSLYNSLPELHIVYNPAIIPIQPVPEEFAKKIKLHANLPEKDYDDLIQECGLCICTSAAESFGHPVNEAMSAGCLLMLSPIDTFRELAHEVLWISNSKVTPNPYCLGNLEDVDLESIVDALIVYTTSQFVWKTKRSQLVRSEYEARHAKFVETATETIKQLSASVPEFSLQKTLPPEDELPKVSVITITRDRRPFIPLAKYCMVAQSYPEDKLEWVIVDDGKDQIKDLISDIPFVKYILVDEPMSIGAKRNLAIERASHDVLVMLDDDDVYPNNSILARVAHMLGAPKKECLFSTVIPCYDIHEKKSFMNVPPMPLGMADRVSEATLCFTRKFWEARKFPDQQIAEGGAFLRGREDMCREMSPQEILVSLCHKKTTSSRKPPAGMEQNGCHYGFADELFTLVSEIGESL